MVLKTTSAEFVSVIPLTPFPQRFPQTFLIQETGHTRSLVEAKVSYLPPLSVSS